MRRFVPIVGNQVATVLLGIIGMKLISTFVPPTVNGRYSLFVTLTQIGTLITHSGIINHTTRYWQREQADLPSYVRFLWSVSWSALNFLAPLLLAVSIILTVSQGDLAWAWMFPLLVVSNLTLALNMIATGALNAGQRHWGVLALSFTGNMARVFLPIGLALWVGMTFAVLSLGYALHGIVLASICVFFFGNRREILPQDKAKAAAWRQELKEYGRPFLFIGIGGWLLQHIDRWIVLHFFGEEQVGYFSFALALGAIVPTLAMGTLMQWSFPKIFSAADTARTSEDWRRVARQCDQITLAFLGLAVVGVSALHLVLPWLLGSLIDEKYASALAMVVPAGFVMINASVNQIYYLLLQGQHNSAAMIKVTLVMAAFKTLGGIGAAAISWPVFLIWLAVCTAASWLVGRTMILRIALKHRTSGKASMLLAL